MVAKRFSRATGGSCLHAMMAEQVARTLNRLSAADFTELLSSRVQCGLSDFIEDFFCSAPDDQADEGEESGGHEYYFHSREWISITNNNFMVELEEEQAGWDLPSLGKTVLCFLQLAMLCYATVSQ